jgi:hypothetical protein
MIKERLQPHCGQTLSRDRERSVVSVIPPARPHGRRRAGTRERFSELLCESDGEFESTACYLLHDGFFLGLFFDREDGVDMFLRNFGALSTDYTGLYPRR